MATKICEYTSPWVYHGGAQKNIDWGFPQKYVTDHKIRVTCPKCKRRVYAQAKYCHDGCCIFVRVPRHKRKGWWKKPKTERRKRDGGKYGRYTGNRRH